MRANEFISEGREDFFKAIRDFLPIAIKTLKLKSLPKITISKNVVSHHDQPTFGRYDNRPEIIHLDIEERHPIDIIRTLAHELVHYKQDKEGQLNSNSWKTGSPQENEAHEIAGIMMREFDKQFPKYLKLQAIEFNRDLDEGWKDWAAAGALGTAMAFGGGAQAKQVDLPKPSVVQQVSKKDLAKTVTGNPHEVVLKKAAERAGIQGSELAAFLSQCAHETMDFKHMKEIGGKLDFKKYDIRFAPKKAKALGNTKPGDGAKYKGRGYIQLTGKYNYQQAGKALGLPLAEKPELVEKPEVAAKVAVWYWQNRVQDKVDNFKDVKGVTKGINPGLKHLDQRQDKFKSFQVAMK